ncbi:MAG: glucosaminidase domain-containing protein [Alphaproteobacteria bacterium]|nr:glucosaminidase domain-containing protein [Alphaproteobacteria bacterium]
MIHLQVFGGRFERGALGVLGAGVLCLYALGAGFFTIPAGSPAPPLDEPLARQADQRLPVPKVSTRAASVSAGQVLPAPEIVHRPLLDRSPEVVALGEIESVSVGLQVISATDLDRQLATLDYSLRDIRRGFASVPRMQLANLPPDLAQLNSVKQRKQLFIKLMLPLILQANEKILADRNELLRLLNSQGPLSREDEAWVAALADRYDANPSDRSDLVGRVDVVPPSLAIAQAAEESGWGTSRFAVEANAVFGQWTFRKGAGVVPERRDPGKRHEVRSFEGLRQSVSAYMHNLNIHWAYKEFRRVRRELRSSSQALTGRSLVGTLHKYSERGFEYIETIRTIMRVNGLDAFDRARLQGLGRGGLGT